jgi:hypothetical protein
MATFLNKQDENNQLGMVDDPNQGVIGTTTQTPAQPKQTMPMGSQSALVGGGGTTARKPTSSGASFTDLGKYLEANRPAVEKAREGIIGDFKQRAEKEKQDISSGIQGILGGGDTSYRPTQDITQAQAEYTRSLDPNYIYDQYGAGNISERTSGQNRLDRSLLSAAGAGQEARSQYEQEVSKLSDYARNLAKQESSGFEQGLTDATSTARSAASEARQGSMDQIRRDATDYIMDQYFLAERPEFTNYEQSLDDIIFQKAYSDLPEGSQFVTSQDKNILDALSDISGEANQYRTIDESLLSPDFYSYGEGEKSSIQKYIDELASASGLRKEQDLWHEDTMKALEMNDLIDYMGGGYNYSDKDYNRYMNLLKSRDPNRYQDVDMSAYNIFDDTSGLGDVSIDSPVPVDLSNLLI